MAGYKETPRQKMIAMMYLVLTALLALNVSKEMLEAFVVVNESVETTQESFANKLDNTYSQFLKQYQINPNKVEEYWNEAKEVKDLSQNLIKYIDSLKCAVIIASDAKIKTVEQADTTFLGDILAKDRYTEPTRFFFGRSEDGTNGIAGDLKRKINDFRTIMLQIINEPDDSDRLGLLTKGSYYDANDQKQTWEQHNFYYTILAADVTILNKLISEVYNAEFDVVNHLYSSVTAEDFKFDEINAKVISKNAYILQGEKYEAEVFVAAYDSKQFPSVKILEGIDSITTRNISRAKPIEGKDGVVKFSLPGNTVGPKKYAGIIQVLNPNGDVLDFHFKGDYIVAPPSLTVAATKMNVFYIGVDNPVSISVPGLADEKIQAHITEGCKLVHAPDGEGYNYIVQAVKGTRNATVSASAIYEGSTMNMGSREFRVKRVPDPVAEIAGQKEGTIEKNTLLAANAIIPAQKDFEFEAFFIVESFTMGTIINGDWIPKATRGNTFSEEMINIIRTARSKQKFFFENIQAVGPDGTKRTLGTINLTIK
ncbi:MAG: gliding motility protein GldM [Bacteroidales bacterium]|nr:gliding motility protein GldM [Bacteroidales bacterium]